MMDRRSFVYSGGLAMILSQFRPWISASFKMPVEMVLMRRNVGFFVEKGGTIGWLNQPDHIVVIDAQWREQADHFLDLMFKGNFRPVDFLINTHHHGDHTSGNIAFKGIAEHVLAHENSKINQRNVAIREKNEQDQLYPDMTYTKEWQHSFGDESVNIHYWGPAHTNGDSIIHFEKANIAHIGDLVFNRKYPYIDRSAGASIQNWIAILRKLQQFFDAETQFIFGHARDGYNVYGGKEDVMAFEHYLTALLELVSKKVTEGLPKEEIMKITTIPGAEEWSGEGIQRSLSAAFEEITSGH